VIFKEFGIISVEYCCIAILLCLISNSIYYSYQPVPKAKHLEHLNRNYTKTFIHGLKKSKIQPRFVCSWLHFIQQLVLLKLKLGNLIEDMPKNGFIKIFFLKMNSMGIQEIMVDN
jgi:hypothetical protein